MANFTNTLEWFCIFIYIYIYILEKVHYSKYKQHLIMGDSFTEKIDWHIVRTTPLGPES